MVTSIFLLANPAVPVRLSQYRQKTPFCPYALWCYSLASFVALLLSSVADYHENAGAKPGMKAQL